MARPVIESEPPHSPMLVGPACAVFTMPEVLEVVRVADMRVLELSEIFFSLCPGDSREAP
jgi:hypothetical protein